MVQAGGLELECFLELAEEHALGGVFRAKAADQEQYRRGLRAHQVGQEDGAVQVTPLKVVDRQDEGYALSQAVEQLPQSSEGAAAQLLRIGHLGGAAPGGRHGRDA